MKTELNEIVITEHTLFSNLLNDEIVVIDLGACTGEFTNKLSEQHKIKKAILVEASFKSFNKIEKKENYIIYNNLISTKDNEIHSFYEYENPYLGSSVFYYPDAKEHKVESRTLKSIMNENSIDYVDILKIDIEGSEYDVLESIDKETYSKIRQITVEFHDFIDPSLKNRNENVIKYLNSLGFKHKSRSITFMNNSDHFDVIFYKETLKPYITMIPKILHMVWVGEKKPPPYFWNNLHRWKSLMPDWTYMIWTNDKLTEEFFDNDYLELIKKISNPSQVSDFIRFYVMNKWGGYYLDADITPIRSLEELPIKHPIVLCNDLPSEVTPVYMMCAFVAGVPNHPLWKLCIEECKKEDLSIAYGDGITPTGPKVLARALHIISGYNAQLEPFPYTNYEIILSNQFTLLPYWYFYRNRIGDIGKGGHRIWVDRNDSFGHHFYAKAW